MITEMGLRVTDTVLMSLDFLYKAFKIDYIQNFLKLILYEKWEAYYYSKLPILLPSDVEVVNSPYY